MSKRPTPEELTAWVGRLHAVVDELAAQIAARHGAALACRAGCAGCCVDGLTVFEIEAARVKARHATLLREGTPHAEGACAFLDDEGRCRIYEERPYVCRTQGLPLRWLERDEGGAPVEARDVCPLNLEGASLEALSPDALWTVGPFEQRLGARQAEVDGGEGRRVALRALFARGAEGEKRRLPVAG
jgi:uncharacterized protein